MIIKPPLPYIPLDFLINADWRLRMSERVEEFAQVITVEDVLSFTNL